jgi:hypothetical protein
MDKVNELRFHHNKVTLDGAYYFHRKKDYMKVLRKIFEEIKTITRTAAYFAVVFILMMIMKKLNLKDYDIEFSGLSQTIIGSLIMAKVIVLMELISLGSWVQRKPPIVDVIIRTLLYTLGVLIAVVLERAFEKRHEAGSYGDAILYVFTNRDIYHVWATIIGAAASIFVYNSFSIVQKILGKHGLTKLFFSIPLNRVEQANSQEKILSLQSK